MQANAAQLDLAAFIGCRAQQPRKPRERNAKRPTVGQLDPHRVFVKTDAGCRNGHAGDCSLDGAQRNPGSRCSE